MKPIAAILIPTVLLCIAGLTFAADPQGDAPDEGFQPLTAWRGYVTHDTLPDGWKIEDGVISLEKGGHGQFLVTSNEFANFDFTFEWKISPGGNSGVFYRSDEKHASPPHTAPEYQIIDKSGHKLGEDPLRSAGACISLYAPSKDVSKPAGEWNTGRIVMLGNHVEHWLNGEKIVEYELGSDDWRKRHCESDFATALDFGRLAKGRIALQGKGDAVWFRKLMIRVLPDQPVGGWADRILILGNSITLHEPLPAIDWPHNHGMAASETEKDYVHLLLRRFATGNDGREPQAMIANIADFERGYDKIEIGKAFKKHAEFQADIVILAIGENVPPLATADDKAHFKKAAAELLALLKTPSGTQRIVVRSSFWPDTAKDEILRQVCADAGGTFVDLAEIAKDDSNRAAAERKFKHAGVANHPGDKGMAAIADAIWKAWRLLPR